MPLGSYSSAAARSAWRGPRPSPIVPALAPREPDDHRELFPRTTAP
jgi:hypothetical protein